ncbi:MAG: DUF1156 domain-containing protein [Acidobacteriota bacterium]
MTYRKKLIEVALPLEAINLASAKEKSIRHGHPSTLHLWWARRPLAACRAVLFASLVDDPSSHPDQFPTEEAQEQERARLFKIIEDLVLWENSDNEEILEVARAEILKSTKGHPPPVYDPFCGGGSIPLEAQRLGLEAHGSDLNPVAVLITKALIEIPPKFAGKPPVNPDSRRNAAIRTWHGAEGLTGDVQYYGKWMRDEAEKRIGHLYPKVDLPKEYGGGKATVIAWLWARTVKCPNPACGALMPLVRSFALSTKKGKEAWVEPTVERHRSRPATIQFEVKAGKGEPPEGTVNRRGARCIVCDTPVPFDHIRTEGKAGRMSAQLMAIVTDGQRSRNYLSPTSGHEAVAKEARPQNVPQTDLPDKALGFRVQVYGMTKHRDLFTPRQLVALATFSDLVQEARNRAREDAESAGFEPARKEDHAAKHGGASGVDLSLAEGGTGAQAYADAVATYLAFGLDKNTLTNTTQATWQSNPDRLTQAFSRQALPMTWDYAEANPLSDAGGGYVLTLQSLSEVLVKLPEPREPAFVSQVDSTTLSGASAAMITTDPPYYDNIGYADLSDFFYVWLRRSLGSVWPELFSTLLVPKVQELIATPHRFDGDKVKARTFFEEGSRKAFTSMQIAHAVNFPMTVFYAFKQAESDDDDGEENGAMASTGWETMLEGLVRAGLAITATWPMRTELIGNLKKNVGALASSVVLTCRPRHGNAAMATRKEFLGALKKELRPALHTLQMANIAPVDLAQASIGPGMAVYSRYAKVLEPDGSLMSVRTALALINQEMDSYLAEQEGEMDADSRFCLAWFEQYGMKEGPFGIAETLSKAKNTSVDGIVRSGCLSSKAGKVRLLSREEMPADYDPATDDRRTVWECVQHLIKQLASGGVEAAGRLTSRMGPDYSEQAKALAYRLFVICERKKWSDEALAYNGLITTWGDVQEKALIKGSGQYRQPTLDQSEP